MCLRLIILDKKIERKPLFMINLCSIFPQVLNEEFVAAPPRKAYDKRKHQWQNVVVMQFVGKALNFSLFIK